MRDDSGVCGVVMYSLSVCDLQVSVSGFGVFGLGPSLGLKWDPGTWVINKAALVATCYKL